MAKQLLYALILLGSSFLSAQIPIYDFVDYRKSLKVPEGMTSERTAVLFSVPKVTESYDLAGNAEKMITEAHRAFVTMGIDAVFYLDQHDYLASSQSTEVYRKLFEQRRIKNVAFLTQTSDGFELIIAPISQSIFLLQNGQEAFYLKEGELYSLMLKLGKEIRRADQPTTNFLIPEKPAYLDGISIVEKSLLKNYPGVLRRSTLAVERFSPFPVPKDADSSAIRRIQSYNLSVERKNEQLAQIMESYPFQYEMIDPMSDDDLIRNRHQYVLRSLSGKAISIRKMLDYEVLEGETKFASIIPSGKDDPKTKLFRKEALVHKFYIKQNISKNVHVGEWDADSSWQQALQNLIGNLSNDLDY